ncbi:MAG: hypothetical protein KAI53_01755 [Candidatus Aenigmarchaeota archaeon]|nr:hypothetical protein [Candidatus Aenigmarchaeota archaeon]
MDIYDLLFYQILKFDPMNNVLTGEFGNDLLYGLLIPGIILFMILSEFSSFVAGNHTGIRHLVTIAALGVIIQSGWYAMIAGVSSIYIPLALVLFIIMFFKRKLIARNQEGAGVGTFGKLIKYSGVPGRINTAIAEHRPTRSKGEVEHAVRQVINLQNIYATQKSDPSIFTGKNTASMEDACNRAVEILEEFNKKQREDIMKTVLKRTKGSEKYSLDIGGKTIKTDFDNDFYYSIYAGIVETT